MYPFRLAPPLGEDVDKLELSNHVLEVANDGITDGGTPMPSQSYPTAGRKSAENADA